MRLQSLDSISMAGMRQQSMPFRVDPSAAPVPDSGNASVLTATQITSLAELPMYASWLKQQNDHFQAALAEQAAFMSTVTPSAQPSPSGLTSMQDSQRHLAEHQYAFMQGVQAGQPAANFSPSALSPGLSQSFGSWPNMLPLYQHIQQADPALNSLQTMLSQSAPSAGLHLLPQLAHQAGNNNQMGELVQLGMQAIWSLLSNCHMLCIEAIHRLRKQTAQHGKFAAGMYRPVQAPNTARLYPAYPSDSPQGYR